MCVWEWWSSGATIRKRKQRTLTEAKQQRQRPSQSKVAPLTSTPMTRDRYLHHRGWEDSSNQIYNQPWAQQQMMLFHQKQQNWEHSLCTEGDRERVGNSQDSQETNECRKRERERKKGSSKRTI